MEHYNTDMFGRKHCDEDLSLISAYVAFRRMIIFDI